MIPTSSYSLRSPDLGNTIIVLDSYSHDLSKIIVRELSSKWTVTSTDFQTDATNTYRRDIWDKLQTTFNTSVFAEDNGTNAYGWYNIFRPKLRASFHPLPSWTQYGINLRAKRSKSSRLDRNRWKRRRYIQCLHRT